MSLIDKNKGQYPHRMMVEIDDRGTIRVPELTLNRPSCSIAIGDTTPYYEDLIVRQDTKGISDGYHTFDELYNDRLLLTAMLFDSLCNHKAKNRKLEYKPFRSKLHHDGTMFDGMFIVGMEFENKYFSYHYNIEYWNLFYFMPEVPNAPQWSQDVDMPISEFYVAITTGVLLNGVEIV